MLSLNTKAIMSLLNQEQMIELYTELQKEIFKNPYQKSLIKISKGHPYCDDEELMDVIDELQNNRIEIGFEYALNLHYWSFREKGLSGLVSEDFYNNADYILEDFRSDDNIPVEIVKYIYSPKILEEFIKRGIEILAMQTQSPKREYSAIYRNGDPPKLTPIDLTFQTQNFIYTTENRDT